MAKETQELTPQEKVANMIFGEEQPETPEEEYQPDPQPVPEGDEAEEVEAKEEQEEAEEFVQIEIDGEVLEVPERYKDYFLRQQDYTQKTQELSAERKALEVRTGEVDLRAKDYEFANSVWDDVLEAQQKQALAQQYNQYLRDNVDNLSSTEIEKIRLAIQDAEGDAQRIAAEVQQKQAEHQQARQQSQQELLNKGTEVLKSRIPNWGADEMKKVHDFALSAGYTSAEVDSILDPRHVEMLWKASQFDALKQGSAQAVKRVQSAPQIAQKPRKRAMPEETKQYLNSRKAMKKTKGLKHKQAAEDMAATKLSKLGF